MQQLTPNQLQAISGGVFDSTIATASNLFSQTTTAFQKGLTISETGVGLVGLAAGAGFAYCSNTGKLAVAALISSYAAYSYFQPDLSSITSIFNFGSTPAQDATTTAS